MTEYFYESDSSSCEVPKFAKFRIKSSIDKYDGWRFGFQAIFHKQKFGKYPESVYAYSPFELVIWVVEYQITLTLMKERKMK